jgi:hypothetical protein
MCVQFGNCGIGAGDERSVGAQVSGLAAGRLRLPRRQRRQVPRQRNTFRITLFAFYFLLNILSFRLRGVVQVSDSYGPQLKTGDVLGMFWSAGDGILLYTVNGQNLGTYLFVFAFLPFRNNFLRVYMCRDCVCGRARRVLSDDLPRRRESAAASTCEFWRASLSLRSLRTVSHAHTHISFESGL